MKRPGSAKSLAGSGGIELPNGGIKIRWLFNDFNGLIAAALFVIYLILGILYESLIHPITIISTLPSAGLGALLLLMAAHLDLSVIAIVVVYIYLDRLQTWLFGKRKPAIDGSAKPAPAE